MSTRKPKPVLAEAIGALNPFGAVRLVFPSRNSFPGDTHFEYLSLRDARLMVRQINSAIKQHEKAQARFVKTLLKTSPWKTILKGGKFPQLNETRGVK